MTRREGRRKGGGGKSERQREEEEREKEGKRAYNDGLLKLRLG